MSSHSNRKQARQAARKATSTPNPQKTAEKRGAAAQQELATEMGLHRMRVHGYSWTPEAKKESERAAKSALDYHDRRKWQDEARARGETPECGREACNKPAAPAWVNKHTPLLYCGACARTINRYNPGFCSLEAGTTASKDKVDRLPAEDIATGAAQLARLLTRARELLGDQMAYVHPYCTGFGVPRYLVKGWRSGLPVDYSGPHDTEIEALSAAIQEATVLTLGGASR